MKKILPFLIVAIVVGGISFYGGSVFAKKSSTPQIAGRPFGSDAGGMIPGRTGQNVRNAAGFMNGEIVSKDGTSITLKLQAPSDGKTAAETGSKVVFYSASTTVSKMTTVSLDELTAGTNVMVIGKTGTDGSVTAQSIQIRPEGALDMGSGNRQGPPLGAPVNVQ